MHNSLTVVGGNADFLHEQLQRLQNELANLSDADDCALAESLRRFLGSELVNAARDASKYAERLRTELADLAAATFDRRNAPPLIRCSDDASCPSFAEVLRAVQKRVGMRVLLVDDDPHLRATLGRQFANLGFEVTEAEDFSAAIRPGFVFDLVIADLNLGNERRDGVQLIASIRTLQPSAVILAHSGYGWPELVCEATRSGANWFVGKPATAERLVAAAARGAGLFMENPLTFQRLPLEAALAFFVERVLHESGGNKSMASRALKIGRGRIDRLLAAGNRNSGSTSCD